ncbi:MAG: rhomboid family intramembrane serine protease [Flavobacteriales bacterium]
MDDRNVFRRRAFLAAVVPLFLVGLMWSIFAVDRTYDLGLNRFGLLPRNALGAIGILTAPLLHADLEHLFNNSLPLLVLGWCLFYFYPRSAWWTLLGSWLSTGVLVWCSARPDHHIGASGVVYALVAFVFLSGLLRRQRQLVALSLLMVFLYGSLAWGVLPIEERMSWESHLWGGISGFVFAWFFRKVPSSIPPPPIYFADEVDEPSSDASTTALTDLGDEEDESVRRWKQELAANANRSTTADGDDIRINYPPF